eukprot:4809838-Prymnesium_polylepis.1
MPPRLLPHERRNPHCPPSPSPAHRADRVNRRDHTRQKAGQKVCAKTPSGVLAHALLRLGRAPTMDGGAGDPTLACIP